MNTQTLPASVDREVAALNHASMLLAVIDAAAQLVPVSSSMREPVAGLLKSVLPTNGLNFPAYTVVKESRAVAEYQEGTLLPRLIFSTLDGKPTIVAMPASNIMDDYWEIYPFESFHDNALSFNASVEPVKIAEDNPMCEVLWNALHYHVERGFSTPNECYIVVPSHILREYQA